MNEGFEWEREVVEHARELLREGGCRARREIVRVCLALDRLLAEKE